MKKTIAIFFLPFVLSLSMHAQTQYVSLDTALVDARRVPDPFAVNSTMNSYAESFASRFISNTPAPSLINPNPELPVQTLSPVAILPITEGTTPTGARTYTMPIPNVAGIDFAPSLGLIYSSQAGSGLAGYGWNLYGLSSITYRAKDIYHDGVDMPADAYATLEDLRFSLDGEPLMPNANVAFNEDYQYETLRSHVMVKRLCADTVVVGFQALYPDGSKACFGIDNSSKRHTVFPITEREDRFGNKIRYIYYAHHEFVNNEDRGFYLQKVQYGYRGNDIPAAEILIDYENQLEYEWSEPTKYFAGRPASTDFLIKSITVEDSGQELFHCDLMKEKTGRFYFLKGIFARQCGEDFNPVSFDYGCTGDTQSNGLTARTPIVFGRASLTDTLRYVRGKFMKNCYDDGLAIYKTNVNRSSSDRIWLFPRLDNFLNNPDSTITFGKDFQQIDAVDINGDGTDELVKINYDGVSGSYTDLKITVIRFNDNASAYQTNNFTVPVKGVYGSGNSKSPMARECHYGSFTGDGRTQLLTIARNNDSSATYTSLVDLSTGTKICEQNLFSYKKINGVSDVIILDMDGDGAAEIYAYPDNGMDDIKVYRLLAGEFSIVASGPSIPAPVKGGDLVAYADINSDGYLDSFVHYEPLTSGSIRYFDGKQLRYNTVWLNDMNGIDGIMFLDLDKDGLPDMIVRRGNILEIGLNIDGKSFDFAACPQVVIPSGTEMLSSNVVNISGASHLVTINKNEITVYDYAGDLSAERLLTCYKDGLGLEHCNAYGDMTSDSGIYVDGTTYMPSDCRKICFPAKLLAVSDIYENDSHTKRVARTLFSYKDAIVHNSGLGFLCFGTVSEAECPDLAWMPSRIRTTNYSPFYQGAPVSEIYKLSDGHLITTASKEYSNYPTPYEPVRYLLSSSGVLDCLSTMNTSESYTYDTYGYPTVQSKLKSGLYRNGTSQEDVQETVSITYSHGLSPSKYVLGNVAEKQTLKCRNGYPDSEASPWKSTETILYNADYLPVQETVTSGLTQARTSDPEETTDQSGTRKSLTCWVYDSLGHLTSESIYSRNSTVPLTRTRQYSADGRFVVSQTDEMGLTTQYQMFNLLGHPTRIVDHKGRITTDNYDAFGNLTARHYPEGTCDSTSFHMGGSGLYQIKTLSSGNPPVIKDYDCLGREIRKAVLRPDSTWLKTDKYYDCWNHLIAESLPYKGATPIGGFNYDYDDYDRLVSIWDETGKESTLSYSESRVTIVKDGVRRTTDFDVDGNILSVTDTTGTITYRYRSDGQLAYLTAPGNSVTRIEYDVYGNRTSVDDPSTGLRENIFEYYTNGASKETVSSDNSLSEYSKDIFGRISHGMFVSFETNYIYTPDNLLSAEISSNGTATLFGYDAFDRIVSRTDVAMDGKSLTRQYTYNSEGQVATVQYSAGSTPITTETHGYTNGTETSITLSDGTLVWMWGQEDDAGRVTSALTGTMARTYAYDAYGTPLSRTMGELMNESYVFDRQTGNLMSRKDHITGVTETFGYDNLNRLISRNGLKLRDYDAAGNTSYVEDVGSFAYTEPGKPDLLTGMVLFDGSSYPGLTQEISYTAFDRPEIISQGDVLACFDYNASFDRVKMCVMTQQEDTLLTRYYLGGCYELDDSVGNVVEKLYLAGNYYSSPMVYVRENGGSWSALNIGRDYLGSVTCIATVDGSLLANYSYDAWGRLRDSESQDCYAYGYEPSLFLGRGYTGHEHLPWFGLINMNARLYDPYIGRFLAPDPYVQDPDNPQALNRYAYALNNPLRYTDESGEFIGIDSWLIGLFTGGIKKANRMFLNDMKIWGGLFNFDNNKSILGRIWEVVSRLTYQLPQTVLGFFTAQAINTFCIFGGAKSVEYLHGATVLTARRGTWGAITMGSYISGDRTIRAADDDELFQHEYGHYLQSQSTGPLWIFMYGIESAGSALFNKNHDYFYTEKDANTRAYAYFENLGLNMDEIWKEDSNPRIHSHYYYCVDFVTSFIQSLVLICLI